MVNEKEYAIVILNYNNGNMVLDSIKKFKNLNKNIQIVLVDNCSTDNSKELFEKELKNIENIWVIYSDENKGYASGNNIGLKFIQKELKEVEYVFIANPDIEIFSINTIHNLVEILKKDTTLAAITTQTIYNNKIKFPNDFGWKMYNKKELMLSGTILGKLLKFQTRYDCIEINDYNVAYIDIIQGCFFGIKTNILKQINFLDENTFLYGEEVILSKKIKSKGYKLGVLTTEFIKHNHKEKQKQLQKRRNKLFDIKCFYDSRKYIIEKYSEANNLYKMMAKMFLNIDQLIKKIYITLTYKK